MTEGPSAVKTAASDTKFLETTFKKALTVEKEEEEVSSFMTNLLSNVYRKSLVDYDNITNYLEKKGGIDHIQANINFRMSLTDDGEMRPKRFH
jgi:hypothetical protein